MMKKKIKFLFIAIVLFIMGTFSMTVKATSNTVDPQQHIKTSEDLDLSKNVGWLNLDMVGDPDFDYTVRVILLREETNELIEEVLYFDEYKTKDTLPTGKYTIAEVGVVNDYTNRFPFVSGETFEITKDTATAITIYQEGYTPEENQEIEEKEPVEVPEEKQEEVPEEEMNPIVKFLMKNCLVITLIIGGTIYFIIKKRNEE